MGKLCPHLPSQPGWAKRDSEEGVKAVWPSQVSHGQDRSSTVCLHAPVHMLSLVLTKCVTYTFSRENLKPTCGVVVVGGCKCQSIYVMSGIHQCCRKEPWQAKISDLGSHFHPGPGKQVPLSMPNSAIGPLSLHENTRNTSEHRTHQSAEFNICYGAGHASGHNPLVLKNRVPPQDLDTTPYMAWYRQTPKANN